jgi:hypothetical protein
VLTAVADIGVGMFLFAKLVMLNLDGCETYQDLVEEITTENFPSTLQDALVDHLVSGL